MGGRLALALAAQQPAQVGVVAGFHPGGLVTDAPDSPHTCLLYTSDAADERSRVDLGGRRIIKKKNERSKQGDARTLD